MMQPEETQECLREAFLKLLLVMQERKVHEKESMTEAEQRVFLCMIQELQVQQNGVKSLQMSTTFSFPPLLARFFLPDLVFLNLLSATCISEAAFCSTLPPRYCLTKGLIDNCTLSC
jgi:hypothetical protein